MKYEKRKNKWVFEKEGVYFALTEYQLIEMRIMIDKILCSSMEELGAGFQKVLDDNREDLYET